MRLRRLIQIIAIGGVVCVLIPTSARGFTLSDIFQPDSNDTPRVKEAKSILRKNPQKKLALYGLGHGLFEAHQYQSARRVYEYALAHKPLHPEHLHTDLAIVYERLGMWDKAVEHYYQAKELVPDFFHPRYGLAYYYAARNENLDEARSMLEEIFPLKNLSGTDPSQSRLQEFWHEAYGFVLMRMGEYAAAEKELLIAYEKIEPLYIGENYPSNYAKSVYNVLFHLGELYRLMDRPEEAMKYYREIDERYQGRFLDRRVVKRSTGRPAGRWELKRDRWLFLRMAEEWSRYDRYRYGN